MTANTQVIEKLNYFITSQRIPNIIFHGSSGSGKRTIVGEFIYRIYNGERARIKTNVMFVNCAHGKGIKFIRDELKSGIQVHARVQSSVVSAQ
jgi:DNA polymerase III delta prime subunit